MDSCPQCGSTETVATPRGGCFGTFLFVALLIAIPLVIGMIVPHFWDWACGGLGSFAFFTQGTVWHSVIVSILIPLLAGLLAFNVFKVHRRDPGRMDITCASCGAA